MISLRARDTIAVRLALTVILAVSASIGLSLLFNDAAGVWARPGLKDTGLFEEAALLERVISAASPASRPSLAAAADNDSYTIVWTRTIPQLTNNARGPELRGIMQRLLHDRRRPVVLFKSDQEHASARHDPVFAQAAFGMAVGLDDGTWLVFKVPRRSWGLHPWEQDSLILAFVSLSTAAISLLAARSLVGPIEAFAVGARRFGSDPRAREMIERGPRELRMAIAAFNAMQMQIRRFVDDRTEMLAAISHDLRTPLTRVRLRGEFINDQEQQHRLFRDVEEMQVMIDSALALFRDEVSEEDLTGFDMSELMRLIVDDLTDQGKLALFKGGDHIVYHGRPLALKRALTNLAENACNYGTSATVALRTTPDSLELSVCDEGPGVPDDLLEKVFVPFYRIERSRNRQTGGVGLGLSSARTIIRAHGGEIVLSNRSAGGLLAAITLPRSIYKT